MIVVCLPFELFSGPYFATEWSPKGRVLDEFHEQWGFPFAMKDLNHPWTQDIARIIENLYVVSNNGPNSIGGGGTPRQPLAAPLLPRPMKN
jgi:hypothetical protein